MKTISIIITILIIIINIPICYSGDSPSWVSFFMGWGLLFLEELKNL